MLFSLRLGKTSKSVQAGFLVNYSVSKSLFEYHMRYNDCDLQHIATYRNCNTKMLCCYTVINESTYSKIAPQVVIPNIVQDVVLAVVVNVTGCCCGHPTLLSLKHGAKFLQQSLTNGHVMSLRVCDTLQYSESQAWF